MNPNFLDFEQPIAELDAKIQELRRASTGPAVNIETEVNGLQEKLRARTAEICRGLPENDAGRRNCESFLKPSAPPATATA